MSRINVSRSSRHVPPTITSRGGFALLPHRCRSAHSDIVTPPTKNANTRLLVVPRPTLPCRPSPGADGSRTVRLAACSDAGAPTAPLSASPAAAATSRVRGARASPSTSRPMCLEAEANSVSTCDPRRESHWAPAASPSAYAIAPPGPPRPPDPLPPLPPLSLCAANRSTTRRCSAQKNTASFAASSSAANAGEPRHAAAGASASEAGTAIDGCGSSSSAPAVDPATSASPSQVRLVVALCAR